MIELVRYLQTLHPLSAEASVALMNILQAKELGRGKVWLQEGAVCDRLTFVLKGLLKLYFDDGAKEMVLGFAKPGEILLSSQSYFGSQGSRYAIRAVGPTVVIYILRKDLDQIVGRFPELNIHLLLIAQQQVLCYEYHAGLLMLPPRERFERLVTDHPWMGDRSVLTDRMLAAYLGVGANAVCQWRKMGGKSL